MIETSVPRVEAGWNGIRVLLINEASGVHKNLKAGLTQLGCRVDHLVINHLKGRNDYDGSFCPNYSGLLGGLTRNTAPLVKAYSLPRYNVINFCNTITAVHGLYSRYLDLPLLRKKTEVLSYYGLGCDEIGLIRRNKLLPYAPCSGCLASGETLGKDCESFLNPRYESSVTLVRKYFDFGASAAIEYENASVAFDSAKFRRIPFPVLIDHIPFAPAQTREVVKIVHTPSRRGFKGTQSVLHAVKILADSRSDFQFSILEGLNYTDYLKAVTSADIIVDQVNSQSCGINALEMLAMGKIVFSGNTDLSRQYFELSDHPALDASPDPELLARGLSDALDRRSEFAVIAENGRNFVARFHDPVAVARTFLEGWGFASCFRENRVRVE